MLVLHYVYVYGTVTTPSAPLLNTKDQLNALCTSQCLRASALIARNPCDALLCYTLRLHKPGEPLVATSGVVVGTVALGTNLVLPSNPGMRRSAIDEAGVVLGCFSGQAVLPS